MLNGPLLYEASWRHAPAGFIGLMLFLSGFMVCGAVIARDVRLVLMGAVPVGILWLAGRRLRMGIDDEWFTYRSWFSHNQVAWRDVTSVTNAQQLPYPRNRNYGPTAYEVRTRDKAFVVTLLYFAPDACNAFYDAVKQRKLSRSARS